MPVLPPLNALRAFEAAARLSSATKAAEELHVTQAAVSHQIRLLEDSLGVELFRRLPRGLMLTDEGQLLLQPLSEAFDQIAGAVERIRGRAASGVLSVTAPPSFAGGWLVPRLIRFQALHPEIEVHIHSSPRLVDLAREPIDIGIRYGRGNWPGVNALRLMDEDIFPVCAPGMLEAERPLRRPSDLKHHTLIHNDRFPDDWQRWLSAAGVRGIDPFRGPTFDTTSLTHEAAATGLGIAIGRTRLTHRELESGRLIAPFSINLPEEYAYYICSAPNRHDQPKARAFCQWIKEEAKATMEGG